MSVRYEDSTCHNLEPSDGASPVKRIRRESSSQYKELERVLLYVREAHENVFTALLLLQPTLTGLAHAVCFTPTISMLPAKYYYKQTFK